jgi:hypothetical protein
MLGRLLTNPPEVLGKASCSGVWLRSGLCSAGGNVLSGPRLDTGSGATVISGTPVADSGSCPLLQQRNST